MGTSTAGRPGAPITGLSHIQLLVGDVQVSAAWYAAALGLESYVEDPTNGYVALRHRAARFVVVLTERTGAADGGPIAPIPTPDIGSGPLDHLALAVPDGQALSAWAEHLHSIGIDHSGVVLENGNPSLQLRDPDGTSIELVAPAPRPEPERPTD